MIDLRAIGSELTEITKHENGVKTKYIVDKVYPFIVKCHDHNGNVECFSIGDLVVMGELKTKAMPSTHGYRFTRKGYQGKV